MRFVELPSARKLVIDWDARVELTDAIRDAMAGKRVEGMRAGVLRRGFLTGGVTFPRGSLAFSADPVNGGVFVELPEADDDDAEGEYDVVASDAGELHRIVVDGERAGDRIDAIIAAVTPLSRAAAQRLIEDGHVTAGDRPAGKPGQRIAAGVTIEVRVPPPAAPIELVAEAIPLVVLHEDPDVIVVDKPAGLVVHPAAGHPRGTLVNALLHHCTDLGGIGGEIRPGIVHRLDKDTSGVIVVAKTGFAHASLTAQFAAKSAGKPGGIVREYLAIAAPPPSAPAGTLKTLHARHPVDRKRFSSKVREGKPAITQWEVVEKLPGAALVKLTLTTGRTHQIRVHAADHGWPLLGDPLYGKTPKPLAEIAAALGRQALHAAVLEFAHPASGERMRFSSPLPPDFEAALRATRSST